MDDMLDFDPDQLDDSDYELLQQYLQGEYSPELAELLESYGGYDDDSDVYERIPIRNLYENCVIPTASQAMSHVIPLFMFCVSFRIICLLAHTVFKDYASPLKFLHFVSCVFGLMILYRFFEFALVYIIASLIATYIIVLLTSQFSRPQVGIFVSVFIASYILMCELIIVDGKIWHSMRGAQMILSMKLISLGFDWSSGAIERLPSILEFSGYCLHVGSVIFGPWFSYKDYISGLQENKPLCKWWIIKVLFSCSLAVLCLIYSTCFTSWLIIQGSFSWLLAYRDAQSFRFSHYFVSFLSEATHVLSGFGYTQTADSVKWDYSVVRPDKIEIPHSLVEVVTNWNLPMHTWLKTYVFKTARPLGNFVAVLLTYGASSLLHGLNFQLAAVLLSLGFYSYIEFMLRLKLASSFDACILAKRCKEKCDHKYQIMNPFVMLTNLSFVLLSMFHLAYLGLMFDNSSDEEMGYTMSHTLSKWSQLNYASHWVAVGTFLFYIVI
ncbi:hypothetical protein SNE40_015288 [Patella caerulea]|uniref:Protein-serine O-palmitoleoyltransferase porcupine n=1 Tax=Patella caerulea TaxID=87958 RepID=A0AAN8JFF1_PATCE